MNNYYESLKEFKGLLLKCLDRLFTIYNHELLLLLSDYNLLARKDNCIESSTAIGYLLEEFITSKLSCCAKTFDDVKFSIEPSGANAATLSYDCKSEYNGIKFLINIKVNKKGSQNNAVSAINRLYEDYVKTDSTQEKAFFVLKIHYDFTGEKLLRVIHILNYDGFFLEEVDFGDDHLQDNRNWSASEMNYNSGRLIFSDRFRDTHKNKEAKISYKNTKKQIKKMWDENNIKYHILKQ